MTIIVPVLNGADVLPLTVDAVLAQPVQRIVYVDDGSTDRTPAILQSLSERDDRVEVITFARNRGRAAARNAGASGARGLLLFLDADVAPLPGYAPAIEEAMRAPHAIAAVGALSFPDVDDSDPYHRYLASSRRGVSARELNDAGAIPWRFFLAGVAAVRAEALHRVGGFPETIRYGEDLALACKLAALAPDGLAHAPEARAALYDLGTLETARAKLGAFARDLDAVLAVCPHALRVAGLERLRGDTLLARVAMSAAGWRAPARVCASLVDRLPPRLQPLAVRYLLGHTLVANAALDGIPRTP